MISKLFFAAMCICVTLLLASCYAGNSKSSSCNQKFKTYKVRRLSEAMAIDGRWDKVQWQKVEALDVKLFMGEKPGFIAKVQAKLLYDDENIYVIFRVEDKYVRARATEYHGAVWEDSCVEFFFTPGNDISKGYFNLEVTAIGTILFSHQILRDQNTRQLKASDLDQIEVAHSLPREVIDPERVGPLVWTVEYRLPIDVVSKYSSILRPGAGVKWRANFYKCADKTSYPHYLTWSLVDIENPDFHRPDFFGALEFCD